METNFRFKTFEVTGETKELAFEKTEFTAPVKNWVNATTAFKNWREKQTEALTEAVVKQFMLDYIESKKIAPGAAAYIVVESAVKDTRERPYSRENVKKEGARTWKNVYSCVNAETGEVLARIADTENKKVTKAMADELAKKLYTENGCKVDINIDQSKEPKNGSKTVAKYKYTPSKGARPGVYKVFGFLNID